MSGPLDELSVAIIGMDARLPGAADVAQYWDNLRAGVSAIARLDEAELDRLGVPASVRAEPGFVPVAANIAGIEDFDAEFFGIGAREATAMDPQHRLLLEGARNALESAGYDGSHELGEVGLFFGAAISQYLIHNLAPQPEVLRSLGEDYTVFGNYLSYACSRIAHKLNLRGPVVALDTACSSSLVAVHLAAKALLNYECDMALAGGVQVNPPQHSGYVYLPGAFRSPDGVCRSFDAGAQGTVFGSGLGVLLLKRYEDALRDGDTVLAVIRGSASNNDGADKLGYTAPGVAGQTAVIEKALAFSGVGADTVSYVETHGTGTPLGDPIEIAALTAAFRGDTDRKGYCAIGSAKPSIGHLETAAGVAGLIKAVLALHHRQLPPSLNFASPNPEIDFAGSPFFVNTRLCDWQTNGLPRRAGVSSFGVGGTNAHVVLEEGPAAAPGSASRPFQLLLWSARTSTALDAATARLGAHLAAHPGQDLADVAYTLQRGRAVLARRRMLVCDSRDAAIAALEDSSTLPTAVADSRVPQVAFLLPGQGSQHVGMAASLYRNERVFRDSLDECARLLAPHLAADLLQVLYPAPEQADAMAALLQQTWLAQPALFAVEYALAKLWQSWGVRPDALLGHSIGEYVAACLAGVFSLADGLRLVALRGRLMQGLPAGEMLAVPLAENELATLATCGWDLAAVNAPRACVLSGPAQVIAALLAELAARGIEGRRLQTSHAFHSAMMDPILDEFRAAMSKVQLSAPQLRYLSNVSGNWITDAEATSPDYWVRHLRGCVRYADGVRCLLAEGSRVLLEVGPGQVLSAYARQQEAARERVILNSLGHMREERDAQAAVLAALGRLWLANAYIDWAAFYADEIRRRVALPTYPYERKRYWVDPPQPGAVVTAAAQRLPLAQWFHVPSWRQAAPAMPAPAAAHLLFCGAEGQGAALAAALRARGDRVISVSAGTGFALDGDEASLRAADPADYQALVSALESRGALPASIIHSWTLQTCGDDYALAQQLGYHSLVALAQALALRAGAEPLQLRVLSRGLAAVDGGETLDPLKAALLGPVKVIAQEIGGLACRHIDISDNVAISTLLAEIDAAAAPPRIALRGAQRWQLDYAPLALPAGEAGQPWREGGTYLITGGLGGLGLVLARHLAQRYRANLLLTGRQGLPPRAQWAQLLSAGLLDDAARSRIEAIQQLERDGAQVLYAGVDVADSAAMRALVATATAQFGPIHGAVHAAGIAGGGILQARSAAQAEAVIAPKLRGAQVLIDALAGQPLDIVLLQASLFGITGGMGQVDYCGANAALDLLAQAHSRRGLRVIALDWDGWADVGMAARAGTFDEQSGGIRPAEGLQALARMLALPGLAQVVISTEDLAATQQRLDAPPAAAVAHKHERPALDSAYAAPADQVQQRLAAIWQDVLGIHAVGIHDNFFDLGGTSLLMSEVLRRIHREIDAAVGITELFQFPTVYTLAARLAGQDAGDDDSVDAVVALGNRRKEALARKRRRPATA